MIPWELSISGVRDYPATRLDLSGMMEHILITGPNGSGKSTLTFCMGAVLGSAKVELEGLRSKNIQQDQVWHAKIQLVFANVGPKPIDAAQYIQFSLHLEQKPGDPLKKEYWIREGERPGEWERETRFTSGDSANSLREYRYQLQHKYVVDPDSFYLIWYQQDVNQFATMRPEERFRIFSEMTQIDRMQRNWEAAKEQLHEGAKSLQEAEQNQFHHKFELDKWQKERDRLLDRNQRRLESLQVFVHASTVLMSRYQQEQRLFEGQMEQLEIDIEELRDRKALLLMDMERLAEEQAVRQTERQEWDLKLQTIELRLIQVKAAVEEREQERTELNDRLKALADQVKLIPHAADEVKLLLTDTRNRLERVQSAIRQLTEERNSLQQRLDKLQEEIGGLSARIEQDREGEKKSRDVLQEFGDSHFVQLQIESLDARYLVLQDETRQMYQHMEQLKQEAASLQAEQALSKRQEQSVRVFRQKGIQVYTLQQLLEMDEHAPLDQEFMLEAVKYSVFVESKSFAPPNDLIHVELPSVVPERSLEGLEGFGIRVKNGLSDEMYTAAMKALWWLHELAQGGSDTKLQDGVLVERYARRGPQEMQQWLLNTKGVRIRVQRLQETIVKQQLAYENKESEWERVKEQLALFRSVLLQVQQAETLLADSAERELRAKQLAQYTAERDACKERRSAADAEIAELNVRHAGLDHQGKQLQQYAEIYDQYEHEREQIERLQQLGRELTELQREEAELTREGRDIGNRLERLDTSIESSKRRSREKRSLLQDTEGSMEQAERQHRNRSEERDVSQQKWAEMQVELQQWHERLPFLWDEVTLELELEMEQAVEGDSEHKTGTAWRSEREQAVIQLQVACSEQVNEYAMENYERTREAYERGAQDVQNSKTLMNQLEEQLQELEDKLFNSIQYEVHRVNAKFIAYMDMFGFDGEVDWHHQESKHGDIKYFLNVRARKQGHRGPLEEVSLKGRGNKVGKGVSGGEESLSSLLFALALLKTIETNPGYIVLDEFDSALDESRKARVFELYEQELVRKMIILSPKSQNADYLQHFDKAFVVYHDASVPQSQVVKIKKARQASGE
ncbi:chromosome segregation protein SMC [Paenibacillus sp. MER TA 81-3]|uniref:chromosome segregation protein SMC n=1 Tax=Paenibacillus sp. MER TA 81-3 TaxID=2939573 RepID=UPI00203CC82A|nr:chromosome segregation protein SMC [Paenibacillus sp. MER TA 81-3]MCM3341218.1 chromosome segregation protein SMC [Paenibacillus sp. MER TA 81-3]